MNIKILFFIIILICSVNITVSKSTASEIEEPPTYNIYTVEDLKAAEFFSSSNDAGFFLMNDIEIMDEIWNPIGSTNRPFKGTFYGNNHTITFTKDTELRQSVGYENSGSGLFGNVCGGKIYDLTIVLQGNLTSEFDNVGPLAGIVRGDQTTGYSKPSEVFNCTVQSQNYTIFGKNNVSGLVGSVNGTIINCSSDCSIKAKESNSGGLIGYAFNINISNSLSTGLVESENNSGGLVGFVRLGNISNVSATGAVKSETYAGGLIGYVSNTTVISDSSANGTVKPKGAFGNFIGGWAENCKPDVINCYYQKEEVDLEPVPDLNPVPTDPAGVSKTTFVAIAVFLLLMTVLAVIYLTKIK
jgi:The GLUG motif.